MKSGMNSSTNTYWATMFKVFCYILSTRGKVFINRSIVVV